MNKKRAAVMSCYDQDGDIAEYKRLLIRTIKKHAGFFLVVCNGDLSEKSREFLDREHVRVVVRENIGFDAGAYKDVLSEIDLGKYNELLLLNDTFFGFFYPLEEFFERSQREQGTDFWGLTSHPKGNVGLGLTFESHIQSYFLFVKERMLHSRDFMFFWENLSYPRSYAEAVYYFETQFTKFFREKGYVGRAYCDLTETGIAERYNINPCFHYPYELVSILRCPVIKRKSLVIGNGSVWKALEYLKDKRLYDLELLWGQVIKEYRQGTMKAYFNLYELELFLAKYSRIYIYGIGRYGMDIYRYLACRNFNIQKFIVSRKENILREDVIQISELQADSDTGIIVALKPEYTGEVLGGLLRRVSREQLFLGMQGTVV